MNNFVGYNPQAWDIVLNQNVKPDRLGTILRFPNLLSRQFVGDVNDWFSVSKAERAGINGYREQNAAVGSDRITNMIDSTILFMAIKPFLDVPVSDLSADCDNWEAIGINPLWRGIRYNPGDRLVAHYDDAYRQSEQVRSLMSVVMYFTNGCTRFMTDPRSNHGYTDYIEWTEPVDIAVECNPGDVIVFDHRLFHDGPQVNQEKRIIRTDVMYKMRK